MLDELSRWFSVYINNVILSSGILSSGFSTQEGRDCETELKITVLLFSGWKRPRRACYMFVYLFTVLQLIYFFC